MQYRAEIDGLRAIAVCSVILFHAGAPVLTGGYLGVDVFFVISGYLIGGIILGELNSGHFSWLNFYERRMRRILPALLLVCAFCLPFALFWMLPHEIKHFGKSLVGANTFTANWVFSAGSGYFDTFNDQRPLLHIWSLAVEEQFYFLAPIALWLSYQVRHKAAASLITIIAAITLSLSLAIMAESKVELFYLISGRAWELALGMLLAAFNLHHPNLLPGKAVRNFLSLLAIAGLSYSLTYYYAFTPTPSAWTLLPTVSTALLLYYARQDTWIGQLLSWKPLVGIGLISYSAYLWHQPLFAFARLRWVSEPTWAMKAGLISATFGLAYLSWKWVETPLRHRTKVPFKPLALSLLGCTAVMIVLGLAGQYVKGNISHQHQAAGALMKWRSSGNPRLEACEYLRGTGNPPENACQYPEHLDDASATVALWGDSHAGALAHELGQQLTATGSSLVVFTYSACMPLINLPAPDIDPHCPNYNNQVLKTIISRPAIETVILHARWPIFIEASGFDNQAGGREKLSEFVLHPADSNGRHLPKQQRLAVIRRQLRATTDALTQAGKRVVLIYSTPEAGWNVPLKLARNRLLGSKQALFYPLSAYQQRTQLSHRLLDEMGDHITRVYPAKTFCPEAQQQCQLQDTNNEPLYFDDDHLNHIGASWLAKAVILKIANP